MWIQSGGFSHLLLGDALTCSVNLQRGGTCAVYSAAALISHYCAVPSRNPAARDSCAAPSGVTCPTAEAVLERAFATGCWTARTCLNGRCEPAVDDITQEERAAVKSKMERIGCAGPTPPPSCAGMMQRAIQAPAGAGLPCLAQRVYPTYGFTARVFLGTDEGWNDVRRSVQSGHPVQVHVSPSLWSQYFGAQAQMPGRHMEHAVVIEAFWTDDRGRERVLVRDSNNAQIVALPSPTVRSSYVGRPGGVAICPPGDTRCRP
jgi:hypothetical protein